MQASSSTSTVDLSRKWEWGNTAGDRLGKQYVIYSLYEESKIDM